METTTASCWACGKEIANPKFFVTEGLNSWGVPSGKVLKTVIHKTCFDKLEASTTRFFLKGLQRGQFE